MSTLRLPIGILLISIVFLCCVSFAGENYQDVPITNDVIVQVGPEKITKAEYNAYLQYRQIELRKNSIPFTPQNIQNFQRKVLDEIVEQTLIFLLAIRENIDCSDEEFQNAYQEGIALLGGQDGYRRWLETYNLTDDYIKEQIKKKQIVDKYLQKIEQTIVVSDKEVEEAYQHYAKLGWTKRVTDTYDFMNILIVDYTGDPEKEKKITEIYQRLQHGEDFLTLAQQFSEDPFSKKQGYCYYEMSLKQVGPEVKHYLILLPVGNISPPFRSRNGWNIIKVLAKNTAGGTIPFEKMKQGLYRELVDKKVKNILREELEKFRKEITITYYQK